MTVRMDDREVDAFLEEHRTGVLSLLRKDGSPLALPMWFVVLDGHVNIRTRSTSGKATLLERDPRVCFVVEAGEAWLDLAAVVIRGQAERLEGNEADEVEAAMAARYASHGVPGDVPKRTRDHYDVELSYYRVVPTTAPLTWRNNKLLRG
ncbi:MAG: pyridoxamine 5'-phosphate oxidase family protein [Xanthomonadales bacterium]|nr:pyridoxamine 5'-phosphate oxidase family protein [Xanthomonadales bacterium]